MGVIDLDARVKKLEQGGGGADPTVIDQLEAAVTALEEAAIPQKTAIELNEGIISDTVNGGAYFCLLGNLIYIHIAVKGLTTTATAIGTLPESARPENHCYCPGLGQALSNTAGMSINATNGTITVATTGTPDGSNGISAKFDIVYTINTETSNS